MLVIHVILFTLRIVEVFGSYWHPHQHMSWNDVIGETHVNSGIHGDVYVVDLFDHRGIIPELLGYTLKTFTYQGEGKKKGDMGRGLYIPLYICCLPKKCNLYANILK